MNPCPGRLRFFFTIPTLLILYLTPLQLSHAQSSPPAQRALAPTPLPAATDQQQFAVYWTTEPGWHTDLQLRNNLEGQDLSVTPALRTDKGQETALPSVIVKPGDVVSVDLHQALINAAPQLIGSWGSVVFRYRSTVSGALYAAVMMHADGRPIVFHLDAHGRGSKYEIGSREGIWWLPWDQVTDYLILTNSGDQAAQANVILYDSGGKAWQQPLTLSARETQRLSVRSLLQQAGLHGAYGGIKIDMAKGARFLDSAHLLFDESGGFSAMMKMFQHDPSKTLLSRSFGGVKDWTTRAPMLALTTPDPALGFPTGTTLQPKLFIHNAAAKPFTAHIYFNWRSAAAAGKTAPLALPFKPNETQVLDVAALQAQKLLPSDAYWATVILSAPVLPEELLAVAASYDQTGRYGTQTPFNDQLASHWEAGAWQVDGTHNSLVTISNGGNKPAIAQLTIFYNHGAGQYQLERPLAPDEQMALDFGKLIHDQVPDKNGNTLPHDLAWGTYRIRDLADEAAGSLYEGKVILDKTYGHATYGCMICCGPQSPWMQFSPLSVPVSGFQNQQVQALNSCTSKLTTITGDFPTWWTDNTSIATATRSQINGIAVGATNHNAQSIMMYWGPKEDSGGEPCPQDQQDTSAGTNVMPQIMFNGQNITGTTQSVVVGQQIALTAAYGNTIPNSQAWTVPGTIVGGFSHSSTNGGPNPINLNGQSTTFYWVTAGTSGTLTANVTFTLNYGNNQTATASSTFTVSGVTSPLVGTSLGNWQIGAGPILEFGDPANTPGITFTKSAVPPTGFPGAYEWVQLVTTGSYSCKYTQANPVNESTPALDTSYPYSTSPSTTDSPQVGLPSSDVEVTWNLAATMYLMWRPGLSNDIYVPLGYVTWQGFGDATQTGGTWSVVQSNSTRNANSFIQSSSYPQWTLTLGQITPCP